jgi:hypothetical protein
MPAGLERPPAAVAAGHNDGDDTVTTQTFQPDKRAFLVATYFGYIRRREPPE